MILDIDVNGQSFIRPADAVAIAEAASALRRGEAIAFPTETVYGLGADASNGEAVAKIFEIKQRPRFNPLIVHVPDIDGARRLAEIDDRGVRLADAFWPGPLTLVCRRRADAPLSDLVSAGLDTVALRVPDHPVAVALLKAFGGSIAAPSANRFGSVSPSTAEHVRESLGDRVGLILDGGPCRVGVESTIVDITSEPAVLLRPGGVAEEDLTTIVGPLGRAEEGIILAPGMLKRHYAPGRPMRLNVRAPLTGEVLLGFGPDAPAGCLNLSPTGNLREAAANLFAMLRQLDRPEVAAIAVMPIPEAGLGQAINDRLNRAAARDDWDDRGPAGPCVIPGLSDD